MYILFWLLRFKVDYEVQNCVVKFVVKIVFGKI